LVKIRLKRFGAKKNPHYRVVVTDVRRARDGAYIESLGSYDPRGAQAFTLEESRLAYWLDKGAQMTPRVKALLKRLRVEQQPPEPSAAEETSGQPEAELEKKEKPEEKKEPLEVEDTEQVKPHVENAEGGSDEGTA
jgi:small subunit ribosomal protein S16